MVERIGEDDVALAGERRDDPDVREVAGSEQQAGLTALEFRYPLFEPLVDRHVAADKARGTGARAPAHRRVGGGLTYPRMVSQAEVVVGAEQQDRLAVEQHARTL